LYFFCIFHHIPFHRHNNKDYKMCFEWIEPRLAKPLYTRTLAEQKQIVETTSIVHATLITFLVIVGMAVFMSPLYYESIDRDKLGHIIAISTIVVLSTFHLSKLASSWISMQEYLAANLRHDALCSPSGGLSRCQATLVTEIPSYRGSTAATAWAAAAAVASPTLASAISSSSRRDNY